MLLSAEHLSINFGSRQLLDDVNFYLNEGDKVGVIGINGTGKSTFLKVLSGVTEPDGGTISRNPNVQVSLLPQNPAMEESATVLEQVFLHFPAEFRELNEYEAKAMLNRLGITDFAQKVGTLSGGQRKRVALAAALIHPADVLILDEPTNHLDSEMVAWLEDWLRRFKGGLVMVTHDRYFLERVVNHITELSRGKLYHYEANYSKYLELREQRAEMAQAPVHPPGGAGVDHAGLQGPDHQVQGADPAVRGPAEPGGTGNGRGRADGGGLQPPGEEDHRAAGCVQGL